ncbi:MAG TPA: hypothetical protein ENK23_03205 [Sorangium sp.]|nr:hypothetical protein [Sorangium sp.]
MAQLKQQKNNKIFYPLALVAVGLGAGAYACSGTDATDTNSSGNSGGGKVTTSGNGGSAAGGSAGQGGEGGVGFSNPDACTNNAGKQVCVGDESFQCDADGKIASQEDCGDQGKICVPGGVGCIVCQAGQFHCFGNDVQQCNVGPPAAWETIATCNANALEHCNPTNGTCEVLENIGGTEPTGTYYQFAHFSSSDTVFKGGYDVDSFGDKIYVNRNSQHIDVYQVTLLDSDGDGELEPNQHPDNPNKTGPIEERVLTLVNTYDVSQGPDSQSEIYVQADRLFMAHNPAGTNKDITQYLFSDGSVSVTMAPVSGNFGPSLLGFDDVAKVWYGAKEGGRRVYSYHEPTQQWVPEFAYPDLAGGHMDGLEIVTDPNTGEAYVYVSDMTSDFIGQYKRDESGLWEQVNLFAYNNSTADLVEGMGFGALNHFWVTSGSAVYELGGGELAKFVEPIVPK